MCYTLDPNLAHDIDKLDKSMGRLAAFSVLLDTLLSLQLNMQLEKQEKKNHYYMCLNFIREILY